MPTRTLFVVFDCRWFPKAHPRPSAGTSASNNSITVTDNDAAVAPTITVATAAHTITADAAVDPFVGVGIADTNSAATDALTITLSNAGATGTLPGSGLSGGASSVYTQATAAPGTVTADLDALVFTPATGARSGNAAEAAGVTISGAETGANGQTVTVTITNTATDTVVDTLTSPAAAGSWSTILTGAQAEALANGTYTFSAAVSDSSGNAATPATQTVTVQETGPTITMAAIDGTNLINAADAAAGVTISGAETGANGQTVTVTAQETGPTITMAAIDGTNLITPPSPSRSAT
jgi:hypothetical protein